ncbi:MAG TPA: CapA family protein [Lapillicoccus sp.]|nr:CapA family protein [Lapillicoccus sp.]
MTAGAVAVLLGLGVAACADPEPVPEPVPTSEAVPPTPSATPPGPTAAPTTSRAPLTADSPVTLAFGGDVHFEGTLAGLVTPDGLSALQPVLGDADVAVLNLETAITDRGVEQPKIYHFRTSPQALVALQRAGVDAVSMANNHAVDYGADGLTDTLAAQAGSPIPVIGIGPNAAKAFAPAVFTVRGTTVAVIASTQVNDYTVNTFPATDTRAGVAGNLDDRRLLDAVRAARAAYDVVVVYLHWGTDYTSCPDGAQTRTASRLSDAGADVVVGGHAHRVQGAGWLGRTYVGYGLGNFIWLNTRGAIDAVSGVLTVSVDPKRAQALRGTGTRAGKPSVVTGATWTPLLVGDDGVPRPPEAATGASQQAAWVQARTCARLAATAP